MSIFGIFLFGNEHVLLARDTILNGGLKSLCCLNVCLIDLHTLHLAIRMAVTLSSLPCISPFNCIGGLAMLAKFKPSANYTSQTH